IQPKDIHADGSLVLDFKMKRITLQYEIKTKDNGIKILYRDVYMKNLHRTAPGVYTFEVSQVKAFATDTAGDLLSYLRVLHPEAANEIRISKVGEKTFFYSLNRQLYNVCTAQ
ncbi:hypothetical protein CBU93_000872, partial [Salmonella enterica subsp. enterica serovar Oranienburg]|nr:hypothetical protein [Salmonella enterica subsp. enterica serovar Oranienburg]